MLWQSPGHWQLLKADFGRTQYPTGLDVQSCQIGGKTNPNPNPHCVILNAFSENSPNLTRTQGKRYICIIANGLINIALMNSSHSIV